MKRHIAELHINTKAYYEYQEAGIIVLTETWLHSDILDPLVEVDNFSNTAASGKSKGGGIGLREQQVVSTGHREDNGM